MIENDLELEIKTQQLKIIVPIWPISVPTVRLFHREPRNKNKIEVLGATNEPLCKNDPIFSPSWHRAFARLVSQHFSPDSVKALVDLIELS